MLAQANEPQAQVATKWNMTRARSAFITAFQGDYERPKWFVDVVLHPPPHGGENPIATVHFQNECCVHQEVNVKVLHTIPALRSFQASYPEAEMITIAVCHGNGPSWIRKTLIKKVARLRRPA